MSKSKTVYDAAQKERIIRNLAKLKEIRFRVNLDTYEMYQKAVESGGYRSMRQFLMTAAENQMKQDLEKKKDKCD